MPKKSQPRVKLQSMDDGTFIHIRVVKEDAEYWRGRHQLQDGKWWPRPPNVYIYSKAHWRLAEGC